jgi:hypothetical protein
MRYLVTATDLDGQEPYWYMVESKSGEDAQLAVLRHLAKANDCDEADVPFLIGCALSEPTVREALAGEPDVIDTGGA